MIKPNVGNIVRIKRMTMTGSHGRIVRIEFIEHQIEPVYWIAFPDSRALGYRRDQFSVCHDQNSARSMLMAMRRPLDHLTKAGSADDPCDIPAKVGAA